MMVKRVIALALMMCLLSAGALAADPTPTPPPLEIPQEALTPPPLIQSVLDIAYQEWESLGGAALKKSNKYTKWRNNYEWGWCAGFITWCMLEAGVPMMDSDKPVLDAAKASEDGFFHADGVLYVKLANVGDLLTSYLAMNRTTKVPQPGYLLVYGASYSRYIHVGMVYDVQPLGDGKFRITTLEGNMRNTVKMYIHDYDMNADEAQNLSMVPKDERILEAARNIDYDIPQGTVGGKRHNFYVNCFLMPWVPGDEMNEQTTPTPPAQ